MRLGGGGEDAVDVVDGGVVVDGVDGEGGFGGAAVYVFESLGGGEGDEGGGEADGGAIALGEIEEVEVEFSG